MGALLQVTEEDINDILGNSGEGVQIAGNISTQTAELIQTRLDMQTLIYVSNFSKSMKRCGEIWLSMARDVYVEKGRKVQLRDSAGGVTTAELMQPMLGEDQKLVTINDLSSARFDVVSEVGPSSSTRKAATVRQLLNMLQVSQDPVTGQVLSAMIMMNMEGEGISEVRDFFRQKMIKMGVVKPNEEEARKLQEEAANIKPSPEAQYYEAAAAEAEAEAVKAQAETLKIQAETDETRADTAKVLSEIERNKIEQAMAIIEKLGPRVTAQDIPGPPIGA